MKLSKIHHLHCNSAAQRTTYLKVLIALGGLIHAGEYTVESFDTEFPWSTYPNLQISEKGGIGGNPNPSYHRPPSTLQQVIDDCIASDQIVSVVLNDQYTAEVLPDKTVKVGCQTFSREVILELAKHLA